MDGGKTACNRRPEREKSIKNRCLGGLWEGVVAQ